MRNPLFRFVCLIALLMPMSGCPAGNPLTLGIWLVHFNNGNTYTGIEFFANGEIEEFNSGPFPIGASSWFEGFLTWEQRGNKVTITQDISGTLYTFNGTLQNSTFMSGMWTDPNDPNNPKPFTATKAPSELIAP